VNGSRPRQNDPLRGEESVAATPDAASAD